MVFSGQLLPVNTDEIHAFSEQYFAEYCVIHGKDMYWTGEKIAAAPEKFRTFLAVNQGRVVGYLDVTIALKRTSHTIFMCCRNIAEKATGESCWPKRWTAISPGA